MTVESSIKKGDDLIKSKDYLGAIQSYSDAIKQNPSALNAFLKRSTAYQKLSNYGKSKEDISTAFTIANERGKRNEIGLCYYKLGLIYFGEKKLKMALKQFDKASEYDCKEATLEMWKNKTKYDLETHPEWNVDEEGDDEEEKEEEEEDAQVEEVSQKVSSSNFDEINKIAPLNIKIREDWYQTNDEIIITIYAKGVNKDKLKIEFESKSVSILFPSAANSEYNYNLDPLYKEIDAEKSSFKVYSTKLEIYLKKVENIKWPSLEKSEEEQEEEEAKVNESTPAYPTSSKKKVNWNKFKVDDDKDEEKDPNDFFKTIFKDVDEDSRRAMMKSYVQSNGTVLTTSWDEAKDKEFETSPPEGMVEKKW
ncbi:unnamed protein product [Candida verbasci]|uniref:Uncharacterized protein n=1 Tax=Candida verbasci TaxID=1227364 RepID=A0A9W4XB31_9ASCO|nr:unnamed protein product [Candida verbasci]